MFRHINVKKKPDTTVLEPEIPDEEPEEDDGDLEVVEEIPHVKGLKKNGQPRKQMSDEVKARNVANLALAREKARLLKKSQSAVTEKEKSDAKEKKNAENEAKKKAKADLKAKQDEQIQEYEKQEHESKVEKIEEVKVLPTKKKKKKAVIVVEQDESDSDIEQIVVKTRKSKKPTPTPAPAPAPVPLVPVPTAYTEQEIAKLKKQKAAFENQQKKEALLLNAIFN